MKFLSDICCFSFIFFCLYSTQPTKAVFNGWEVEYGQFPSIVRISVSASGKQLTCSGVLLDNLTVLSAGHCFPPLSEATLYIGDYNSRFSFFYRYQRKSNNIIRHEKQTFTKDENVNDLALIFLDKPMEEVKGGIKYGKLASKDMVKPGQSVSLVGWGEPNLTWLYAANLTILPNEDCFNKFYNNFKNNFIRDGKVFCIQGKNGVQNNACVGDSGAPAYFVDDKGEQWITGIATFAEFDADCNTAKKPSVIVNIVEYLDWIEKTRQLSKHVKA